MHKFLCLLLVFVLASACSVASALGSTPSPTAPDAPGVYVNSKGANLLLTEINEGSYFAMHVLQTREEAQKEAIGGQYQIAREGNRFIQVTMQVLQGADSKDVYEWDVQLKDSQGNLYKAVIRSSGLMAGGEQSINWVYVVPNELEAAELVFPDNVSADLSPLLSD